MDNSSALKFGFIFTLLLFLGQCLFLTNIYEEGFVSLTPQYEVQYFPDDQDHNLPETDKINDLLSNGKINEYNQYTALGRFNNNFSVIQIEFTLDFQEIINFARFLIVDDMANAMTI